MKDCRHADKWTLWNTNLARTKSSLGVVRNAVSSAGIGDGHSYMQLSYESA